MERQAGNYFTIWYGVYQPSTHTLRYAGAGHPPAIILAADGSEPVELPSHYIPIGVIEESSFEAHRHQLTPGTALLLYSDGLYDLSLSDDLPRGRQGTLREFIDLCAQTARAADWTLDDLVAEVKNHAGTGRFDDDCTLVRMSVR